MVRKVIPAGTEFADYGVALSADRTRYESFCGVRRKRDDGRGSTLLRTEKCAETWPPTRAGWKAACAWSLAMNEAEGERVGVLVEVDR